MYFIPWLYGFAASAPCREVLGFKGVTVLWYGIFVGIPISCAVLVGASIGWQGIKVLRDKQFPPIGQKVTRPTRIKRGSKAKWLGWLHILACSPFLVIALWGGFQANAMSEQTFRKPIDCANQIHLNRSEKSGI